MIANDEKSILKWTLNRAEEAKNTSELLKMADIGPTAEIYKATRPSQILKSEKITNRIETTLNEEYINPFGADLDKQFLYNLSSGVPVDKNLSENILKIKENGKELLETFADKVLVKNEVKFHDPIKRQNIFSFESSMKIGTIARNNISKTVEVTCIISKKWKTY